MNERTVIDEYLDTLSESKRETLQALRLELRKLLPEAEECISYGMPGFRLNGKMIAGFAAFTNHLSYFPHSGKVLPELAERLNGFKWSAGTLQFDIGKPLPKDLIADLVQVRLDQIATD